MVIEIILYVDQKVERRFIILIRIYRPKIGHVIHILISLHLLNKKIIF